MVPRLVHFFDEVDAFPYLHVIDSTKSLSSLNWKNRVIGNLVCHLLRVNFPFQTTGNV